MTAAAALGRPRFDQADLDFLQPESDPEARYKPRQLYDLLMGLTVATPTGERLTVKIRPYRMAGNTPANLESNGDPDYATLQGFIKRSKNVSWKHGSWVLTVDVRDGESQADPFGVCHAPTPGGISRAPLAIPLYRPPMRSYFSDLPSSLDPTHVEVLKVHNHEMMRFFTGKARPSEIRRALFLAQVVGAVAPDQEALQAYCDAHTGMDCSGMASIIYGYVGKSLNSMAFRTRGVERTRISDFQAGDAIVWRHDNHIAVIDHVGPGANQTAIRCWVAESTGARLNQSTSGVQYSEYTFEADDTDRVRKYRCLRPSVTGAPTLWSADRITVRGNP
jgi:hypothetical protein